MGKGIYDHGYLPHWDFAGSVQGISFRLNDSIPSSVLTEWQRELASGLDEKARQRELHRRISRFEDSGHGDAFLIRADCAEVVQRALISGHPGDYRLIDWCVMPNHVHVLCKLEGRSTLGGIVQRWKGRSAVEINRLLERKGRLWQREYYDRLVRDIDHFCSCRSYIRMKPVKAGLCEKPEDWAFSSAGCHWGEAER